MPRNKKHRKKFTPDELKKIEVMFSRDLGIEHISALLGLSDTWFAELMKKDNALQLAKRLGRAKASLKVKSEFWKKIDQGEMKAIELWLKSKEGYYTGNKLELSGPEGAPIETHEMSKEELKARVMYLRRINDLTEDE